MEDIRDYTENELCLRVFNDELLYNRSKFPGFIDLINETFIYTDEQLANLKQNLKDQAIADDVD